MASQIKIGAILSYVGILINMLIGLIYTPWMIHSIGRDNYGLYTLAMSVITLFVFDFGLSSAVTRFVAKYLADDRIDKANDCLGLVYKLYLFIDILLFAILISVYFFIPQIYDSLTPTEVYKFKIVYIMAAGFSVISFPLIPLDGILKATEKFIQLKLCVLVHKLIIVATMSICLLLGYGLYALVAVNTFAGIVMIAMKLYCIKRYTKIRVNFQYENSQERNQILGFSGWVTVTSLCQRMIFNIAPSILGIMSGSASIAILGVAITIEGYTYTFASAINGMFIPRVSKIMSTPNGEVLPLMIRIGRIQILIIGLLIIGYICLGREFINLWVGSQFDESYICAILLIIPSFFHLPQEIAATAIVVMNKVKLQAIVFVVMACFNICFAIPMTHYYGVIGLSASICMAYFIRTIGLNIVYYKSLHIDIFRFFKESYLKMIPPLILMFIAGGLIQRYVPISGWVGFIYKGTCFFILYGVIMLTIAMNAGERQLILTPIRKSVINWKRKGSNGVIPQ